MTIRANYWSNSKFADKIRGSQKPKYLSMDGWNQWQKDTKRNNPVRYYISEHLNTLQDITYYPIDVYKEIKYYIKNRFITKTHALTSGLKRGEWYDLDQRILYSVFNELKNFVEVECAHNYFPLDNTEELSYNGLSNKGISSLIYIAKLKHPEDSNKKGLPLPQAIDSLELLELYSWWIHRSKLSINIDKYESGYEEDNAMLVRLISIRHTLWT